MPSRLSSLLVRDGIVSVKRMERAFQRQVIYGGALDTILLEMSLIDETTLCRYLSAATGLPSASGDQLDMISSEATDVCPEDVAKQFHVAPLTIDNEALRVLVSDPVDFGELEDLADQLDIAIQPLVAPEFRFNLLFARAFGLTASARFKKLAEVVGSLGPAEGAAEAAPVAPVETPAVTPSFSDGTPESLDEDDPKWTMSAVFELVAPDEVEAENVVPEGAVRKGAAPTPESVRSTMRFSSDSLRERMAQPARAKQVSDAYRIVRPVRDAEPDKAPVSAAPAAEADYDPTPVDAGKSALAARGADRFHGAPRADDAGLVSGEIDRRPEASPGAGAGSLSVADAQAQLAAADDRDEIFELLLRAVATKTGNAALLIIQGGAAMGRIAVRGGELVSEGVSSAAIPLSVDSPFRQVNSSASPYIGRLASGNPDIDSQVVELTGSMPPSALLLPVALRQRVVAIVVGHRDGSNLAVTELSELLPLAGATAEALIRLIRYAKKQAAEAARAATQLPPRRRSISDTDSGWDVPDTEVVDVVPPPRDEIDQLLDQVESTDRAASDEARRALLGRVAEVVPRLDERFPGRLDVDRYEIGRRTIRASQYGPLMDLVVMLGAACGPMLAAKLGDERRDVRYYAAVCAAELRPTAALEALIERLFDRDYGVRDIALHALSGYPARELNVALGAVRAALGSSNPEEVVAAANAVAFLGDLSSVPHLLEVLEGDREAATAARRALRRMTCQDFAWNARKWQTWWDDNRERHRIEWLLEALGDKDEELRRQAADDLRSMTGESYGYNYDAARREREEARGRWIQWWEREGRRRFGAPPPKKKKRSTSQGWEL